MIKVTLNIENFESMKNGTFKEKKASNSISPMKAVVIATGVGALAGTLIELAAMADNKIGKTAKLIKELVRIFSI